MTGTDRPAPEPAEPSPDAPVPDPRSASTAATVIGASPREVFDVLVDPTTYPEWLVGARTIRGVDPDWPRVGASFRHTIGWGPARIPGSTSVLRCRPPHELVLAAGMGPLGEASVRFELSPTDAGSTSVLLEELPARGPARAMWRIARPLVRLGLWGRNAASLDGLAAAVRERRSSGSAD